MRKEEEVRRRAEEARRREEEATKRRENVVRKAARRREEEAHAATKRREDEARTAENRQPSASNRKVSGGSTVHRDKFIAGFDHEVVEEQAQLLQQFRFRRPEEESSALMLKNANATIATAPKALGHHLSPQLQP
jgi:hypothetical protein